MAKYLGSLITPHIPDEYCTQDSFSFIEELKTKNLQGKFLVSFDVTSLFTNIPLDETIELAVDLILKNNNDLPASKNDLIELFKYATKQTHFLFNGEMYDQIDGVAMGSPLAPILANLFMGHHERQWLRDYTGPNVPFYRRYVDDVFCIFDNENEVQSFHDHLNSRHANIQFTTEKEVAGKLPFLDILINNGPNGFTTTVYHKKNYTGLYTNFLSFTSRKYKIGLIRTLVDRTYKLCSSANLFNIDVENLKNMLMKNMYPSWLIDRAVKQYLNKVQFPNQTDQQKKTKRYFKLPYIGNASHDLERRINSMSKQYCKNLQFIIAFSSFKLSSLLSVKDAIPQDLRARVIYQFTCARCNSRYVGQTKRHFTTRVQEHLGKDKNSHVWKHLQSSPQCL